MDLVDSVDETDKPEPGQAKPVFCTGSLGLKHVILSDDEFGVTVESNALMYRQVEVYCYR